ncbi:MAG: pepN [Gammaproteobacteria bacterium]|jgi:aminopeptidase N|nr:pepN [Gammaproteobacteria bacterium]
MQNPTGQAVYLADYKVPDYLIDTVDLEFDLREEFTIVTAKLAVYINPSSLQPSPHLILNGEMLELLSVVLDGKSLTKARFQKTEVSLIILDVPQVFTLEIQTRIKPQENTALSGLYKSGGNFCTQCEAQGFRRITYFLDRPDVMARFKTTLIAHKKRYPILLSNGNEISNKELSEGRHAVTWEDPFKKPCYLFALVAGKLDCAEDFFITQSGRRVILRIYVELGHLDKCAHAMKAVKKAMRWDEEKFGREYDLDIYMIVAVSDFNMGAMENKGLNIFNTQYILAKPETATDTDYVHIESVIAHEYCHNWTGNRITCRDWFQLSLKEGLTIFRDQNFTADTTSPTVARINDVIDLRTSQFPEDAGPLAHPVRPDSYVEINNFYTSTVYNKGAEVIRMQQTLLGEAVFRKGMDLYFARYDGQAVTIEEFVKSMEDASGIDLKQFRLWYSQAGTPVLDVTDQYDAQQKKYTLKIKQSCPVTPGQPEKKPFHIPIKIGLMEASGKEMRQDLLHLKEAEQAFQFSDIATPPIPSLLRGFSAPVKINYAYSDAALQLLFKSDTDLFNRWEAGQRYTVQLILRLINDYHKNETLLLPTDYIAIFQHLLETMQDDKLLLAEMLTLPSEKYIAAQMAIIDVEAIHFVRKFIMIELATHLQSLFCDVYQENNEIKSAPEFTMEGAAKRHLKNVCLAYLMTLGKKYKQLTLDQFKIALSTNMTDTIAALRPLMNIACPERETALTQFYQQWKNDPLVIDKWFALQGSATLPDTLGRVRCLLEHPAFDLRNPNKVYSLIGTFAYRNPVRFHVANGEGYQFLADCVLQLDSLNPQLAARLVKPLSEWQRYDPKRQDLMRNQLKGILRSKSISRDVGELVSKSLE